VITPVAPGELSQVFGTPPLRVAAEPPAAGHDDPQPGLAISPPTRISLLSGLPLAEIVLDAILRNPHGGPAAAAAQINARIAPAMELHFVRAGADEPATPDGLVVLTHALRAGEKVIGSLQMMLPRDEDEAGVRHFLAQLAMLIGRLATVEDRYARMEKLAVTDDLTGLANSRYFHSFLTAIIKKAQAMRFPVTLLLFDIDGFKKYNDQFGHKAGDEILRATASLIKRCVRDHDLVARLHGDEFAVIFWEKEGPRQPREGNKPAAAAAAGAPASRIPQTPKQMFQRFQRMLASNDFQTLGLGPNAKGKLTISAAIAVYPYDAQSVEGLIDAADHELMFNAKVSGKNCLRLVGEDPDDDPHAPEES
jgi:GGDEF domain-containing protein